MHVVVHSTGRALVDAAGPLLDRHEAENALLVGICRQLGERGDANGQPAWLVTVHDEHDAVVAAAIRTPPRPAVITRLPEAAAEALCDALRAADEVLPGVVGPREDAERFARVYGKGRALRTEFAMRQGLYALEKVTPPPAIPGSLRTARPDEEATLVAWAERFVHDTGLPHDEVAAAQASIRRGIPSAALHVWDDGGPVCMALATGHTGRCARVGFVYTPPERRRRGYAASCVAGLSQKLLDAGLAFCTLYTDLANPTSNRIYQRIGYVPLGESVILHFAPSPAE